MDVAGQTSCQWAGTRVCRQSEIQVISPGITKSLNDINKGKVTNHSTSKSWNQPQASFNDSKCLYLPVSCE